jgi:excinuclease UvrABC helicase subunit UvrB
MEEVRLSTYVADARSEKPLSKAELKREADLRDPARRGQAIAAVERRMKEAAANLEFELAALLRDQLIELKAAGAPDVQRGGLAPPRPARARRRA